MVERPMPMAVLPYVEPRNEPSSSVSEPDADKQAAAMREAQQAAAMREARMVAAQAATEKAFKDCTTNAQVVMGMEDAEKELLTLTNYSLQASFLGTQGFVEQPPSLHAMLLWQETTIRSLHQRMTVLKEALEKGLKQADDEWPKRLRNLLESDQSDFKLGRFPRFIDAVVDSFKAACTNRDRRIAEAAGLKFGAAPPPQTKLLTVAADAAGKRRMSVYRRLQAAASALADPEVYKPGTFVDETAARELAENPEVRDPLSLDALLATARSLDQPHDWIESTTELRRELKNSKKEVREAVHKVQEMRRQAGFDKDQEADSDPDDDAQVLDRRNTARYDAPDHLSMDMGQPASEEQALEDEQNAQSVQKALKSTWGMLRAEAMNELIGKLDYERLQAMRNQYMKLFKTGFRDDLKHKLAPSKQYGKLIRRVTMSRAEWAAKAFREARALDSRSSKKEACAQIEIRAIEALCVCDASAMKELEKSFEKATDTKSLLEEVKESSWLNFCLEADKVRELMVSVVKNRLGVGGIATTNQATAKKQGETLADYYERDDPLGLFNLCRTVCGNHTREHLEHVRNGFVARSGEKWHDQRCQPKVLKNIRGNAVVNHMHAALSLCFDEPQYYFANFLYNECNTQASSPAVVNTASGTWSTTAKTVTEALSHLVTLCKDNQLAAVNKLLSEPPFDRSLGDLVLQVTDSDTRNLLSNVTDHACNPPARAAPDVGQVSVQ